MRTRARQWLANKIPTPVPWPVPDVKTGTGRCTINLDARTVDVMRGNIALDNQGPKAAPGYYETGVAIAEQSLPEVGNRTTDAPWVRAGRAGGAQPSNERSSAVLPILLPDLDRRGPKGGITMKGYVAQKGNRWYAVIYHGLDPMTGREQRSWHPAGAERSDAERHLGSAEPSRPRSPAGRLSRTRTPSCLAASKP